MALAAIFDCEGPCLSDDERAFFREADPWGFIFFARHCESPEQMRRLSDELRTCVGREAPILIDQEGGRVARLRARQHAHWPDHPPMGVLGQLWRLDPVQAQRAAWLNGFLLAQMVSAGGVTVNCVPSLDIPQIDADPVTLGDRALAAHTDIVIPLARSVMAGSCAGGAIPVIKHMPGLGRALCDSHKELPSTSARKSDLQDTDFVPFKAINDAPIGMTAHVVYESYDPDHCATHSSIIIQDVIRDAIGFDGLLLSDDLKMEALGGDYPSRAEKALAAGCDIALACNFDLAQKQAIARSLRVLDGKAKARAEQAMSWRAEDNDTPFGADDLTFDTLCRLLKPVWHAEQRQIA